MVEKELIRPYLEKLGFDIAGFTTVFYNEKLKVEVEIKKDGSIVVWNDNHLVDSVQVINGLYLKELSDIDFILDRMKL